MEGRNLRKELWKSININIKSRGWKGSGEISIDWEIIGPTSFPATLKEPTAGAIQEELPSAHYLSHSRSPVPFLPSSWCHSPTKFAHNILAVNSFPLLLFLSR
jgi:hypothetical protein